MNLNRLRLPKHRWSGAIAILGVLLAFVAWFGRPAFGDDPALVDSLFPLRQMNGWTRASTPEEGRKIDSLRNAWLGFFKLGGRELSSAITDSGGLPRLSDSEFEKVLERLARVPVRICTDSCRCPSGMENGCISQKRQGPLAAEMLFIRDCAFRSEGCVVPRRPVERLSTLMAPIMVDGTVRLILGDQGRRVRETAEQIARGALRLSVAVAATLPTQCPGPFASAARPFLESAGFLRRISAFGDRCSSAYLNTVVGTPWDGLPGSCRRSLDSQRWSAWEIAARRDGSEGVRCEAFCETLTCGDDISPVPRVLLFGGKALVSLPADACAGSKPQREALRGFMSRAVQDLRRTSGPLVSRESEDVDLRDCRESLLEKALGTSGAIPADGSGATEQPAILEIEGL